MEEWVGERWHRFISKAAEREHQAAAVALDSVLRPATLLFRAAGGPGAVRLVPAGLARVGGPRDWLQRLAGSGLRAQRPQLDADTLALPPRIAVHAEAQLNRELYLWLAALAAAFERSGQGWLHDNLAASARALQRCPGLRPRWQRLLQAELALRPRPERLKGAAASAEAWVQAALQGQSLADDAPAPGCLDVAPVWMWLEALPAVSGTAGRRSDADPPPPGGPQGQALAHSATRRRTQQIQTEAEKRPVLLLPAKIESLLSWNEHVPLDRAEDDEDDGHALAAADDMEQLHLSREGQTRSASRVRFDLDLPSASADDLPLGEALQLPEWDWKQRRLLPAHCAVQTLVARPDTAAFKPGPQLRASAGRMRRRLELLRAAPRWQRACADGEQIDIDAWVRHSTGLGAALSAPPTSPQPDQGGDPLVFARRLRRGERSLASLLLADLSMSTDAYCNNEQRVIDVIRDALYVFGEALSGCGDAFAMLGFSSVRRNHVRLQHLKGFDEGWKHNAAVQARVGAIRPGYYTRMGAALRAATLQLQQRPERQRLLLLLTDGKPNDLDVYEGRWGIEDTRQAVREAREAGLTPFCISIDADAHDYLPHLFGSKGWAQVRRPEELPQRLTGVYASLVR